MNMYLIIIEGNYEPIDADDFSCNDYYNMIFSSYLYTLQSDFNIDGQVISSDEIVFEGNYYFPININFHYYVSPKNKSNNMIVYPMKIINGNVYVVCYDSNDVVP